MIKTSIKKQHIAATWMLWTSQQPEISFLQNSVLRLPKFNSFTELKSGHPKWSNNRLKGILVPNAYNGRVLNKGRKLPLLISLILFFEIKGFEKKNAYTST